MNVRPTELPGVLLVEPRAFGDARGFFLETYQGARYAAAGITQPFIQDNHSRSVRGTLRGLHYQIRKPQGKLVSVVRGAVFDVAVDLRKSSPHFGKWFGTILSDENHHQLWIPEGFGHGFLALTDLADMVYKVTADYDAGGDRSIAWNDPTIAIRWPDAGVPPILSAKDAAAPRLEGNADLFA
jgi:dTDP-4-dehydrorhamnose 3,5-epimerase